MNLKYWQRIVQTPTDGGDGGQGGGGGGSGGDGGGDKGAGGGQGGGGGGGGSAHWLDAFPTVKGNAELAAGLQRYKTADEAFAVAAGGGFGSTWREDLVATLPEADRAAELERLQRYDSPKSFFEADRQAHQKLRTGQANAAAKLPQNPNEQELKAYREANGIPAEPAGYFQNLPSGLVIGENDKEVFDSFATAMHGANYTPAQAQAAIKWYNDFAEATEAAQAESDKAASRAAVDALREAWGPDYRNNMATLANYVETLPKALQEALNTGRNGEGVGLLSVPEIVGWLVQNARDSGHGDTVVGADGKPMLQSIEARLAEIKGKMNTKEYRDNPKMQQEYRDLLTKQEKLKARSKAA